MPGLALILLFQLAGEVLQQLLTLPLPGALLGMLLFLAYLVIRKGGGQSERASAGFLIRNLPLFFIPAGVGVITYGAVLAEQALAIILALSLGTVLAFGVTAWLMDRLLKLQQRRQTPGEQRRD